MQKFENVDKMNVYFVFYYPLQKSLEFPGIYTFKE